MNFLVTEDRTLTYKDLIDQINKGSSDNFFSSFVAGMVSNDLIDLSCYRFNQSKNNITDIDDLRNRIVNSQSVLVLKTSGTTGTPKIKTHKISSLLKNTKPMSTKNNWLFTYNNKHMGGIQVLLQALVNLDCINDVYRRDREYILKQVEGANISHISATPTFYRMLLPFNKSYDNVQRVTIGGERSDVETISFIRKIFPKAKINNIYATTETGALLFSSSDVFTINDRVFVDGTLKVKLDDGSVHDTGDLVQMISDTDFVFCGRNTNIINVGGNNVNPIEVEDVIKSHCNVKDAVVYGRPNKLLGNVLTCDVVLLEETTKNDLREHIRNGIAENYKIPRIIKIKDSLEVSDTNKVIR